MILGSDKDPIMKMSPGEYLSSLRHGNLVWEKTQLVFDLDTIVNTYGRDSDQYKHYKKILERIKDELKRLSTTER